MSPAATGATGIRSWSALAIDRLLDDVTCPVCEQQPIRASRCARCGADFTGEIAGELWDASRQAAAALEHRRSVLARVPFAMADRLAPTSAPAPVFEPAPASAVAPSVEPGTSATVQSVLAVAGAALVAVAAIVFTFFNPDLTDRTARSLIIAATTLLFVLGAFALVRRGLRFSAEAVGALAMVFVALDVHAFASLAPDGPWLLAAVGTLVAGTATAALGMRMRLRIWLWSALIALSLIPAMLGLHSATTAGGAIGWFATAAAASLAIDVAVPLGRRLGTPLRAERGALTVVQLAAVAVAFALVCLARPDSPVDFLLGLSALLAAIWALALASARHPIGGLWSFIAGGAGTFAVVAFALAVVPQSASDAVFALLPAAGVLGLLLVAALVPLPRSVHRGFLTGGAVVATAATAVPTGSGGLLIAVASPAGIGLGAVPTGWTVLGLAALAGGLMLFAWLRDGADAVAPPTTASGPVSPSEPAAVSEPPETALSESGLSGSGLPESGLPASAPAPVQPLGTRWLGDLGRWIAVLAALTLASDPAVSLGIRMAIGLGLATCAAAAAAAVPGLRLARPGVRLPLVVGAHLLVIASAVASWRDDTVVVWAGVAVVSTIVVVSLSARAGIRHFHVGAGYAYALVVLADALAQAGLDPIQVLCLTTSAGAVTATAATFLRPVRPRAWVAILIVTSVPFLLGVAQVVFERSGWTALSTGLIFLLALALVVTRRPGLGRAVRALAAGILVPSLAVVVVCLGAELLVASGSPVVLPVIAVLVAVVLPGTAAIGTALGPRIGAAHAILARRAIEVSTLLTAAITVALALLREAAGLGTTFIVLVVLGVGAAATSLWARRAYGWWMSGAAFTGALWCVWGMAGVDVLEPYLLPPALGAAGVGALLTARTAPPGRRGAAALYATGLGLAVVPVVAVLAVQGGLPRGLGLIAASWLLVGAGALLAGGAPLGRRMPALRALRPATFAAALAAGAAAAVQGARLGAGLDPVSQPAVFLCLAIGLAGAVPAALAARGILADAPAGSRLSRSRWLYAPAALYPAVAAWPAIHRDWPTIWTMWALMLAYLVSVLGVSWGLRRSGTNLPPVWFLFAIAFTTAIVAWSPRDLRVEWFSLPLGVLLLAAGALHLRAADAGARHAVDDWPTGRTGSWALLGPGIVVTLSASVAATLTDPLTWRAILVIVLALAAILVGARARLAAPFFVGIVVLPVENALAFIVQIGRGIESMPWWITLAVVGAVLLIIAVTYERRAGEDAGIAARLRDLA